MATSDDGEAKNRVVEDFGKPLQKVSNSMRRQLGILLLFGEILVMISSHTGAFDLSLPHPSL